MIKANSFLALANTKQLRCEKFLDEMEQIMPWGQLITLIGKHSVEQTQGRKRKELILMIKIHCLQQWYDLSDPAMEEAIYDRNSFQKFLGLDLLSEAVPDETTILNFRHLLEEHKLQEEFFRIVNKLLVEKGLIMRKGTIVDATIIQAPASTKNQEKQRDEEMSSTYKHGQWYFGMKMHIGVDAQSGLIHHVTGTTAKVHDSVEEEHLYHGVEQAQYGDKGYAKDKRKREFRAKNIFYGFLDKGKRGHALSSSQKKRNRKLSSVRSKVEFPFNIVKNLWKHRKVRYRGLAKNTLQFTMLFALANLYRVRKKLIAA
jgi:transposase, IS5 family